MLISADSPNDITAAALSCLYLGQKIWTTGAVMMVWCETHFCLTVFFIWVFWFNQILDLTTLDTKAHHNVC